MKILLFIPSFTGGGAERVASILLNHLCQKHQTFVAVSSDASVMYDIDPKVTLINNSVNCKSKVARKVLKCVKTRRTIKDINPDLIISFIVQMNGIALFANLLTSKRILVSERTTTQCKCSISTRIIRKVLYPIATKVVLVSEEDCIKSNIKRKTFIYNPKHLENYSNYEHRSNTIVSIGTQYKWHTKGFDLLIEAWARIEKEFPNWQLEFLGADDADHIHKLVDALNIKNRVSFLGWTNDIASTLQEKSIYVLASRHEGLPNSLLEAMSQGCACIATDCHTGPKEIITNNVSGMLIPTENIEELAATLRKLISNEDLRRRLSAGAIIEANRFDKDTILQQWDSLIEEVATNDK